MVKRQSSIDQKTNYLLEDKGEHLEPTQIVVMRALFGPRLVKYMSGHSSHGFGHHAATTSRIIILWLRPARSSYRSQSANGATLDGRSDTWDGT
jgi:hypothetical protein